jgi:hypothetical protein
VPPQAARVQAKPPIEPDEAPEAPASWQPDLAYRLAAWREAAPGEADGADARVEPEKWWQRAPPVPTAAELAAAEEAAAGRGSGLTAGCLALAPGEAEAYGQDEVLAEATLLETDFKEEQEEEEEAEAAEEDWQRRGGGA